MLYKIKYDKLVYVPLLQTTAKRRGLEGIVTTEELLIMCNDVAVPFVEILEVIDEDR